MSALPLGAAATAHPRRWELADAAATTALGARLATLLPAGATLLLEGNLGAGKTTLVQGLAAALGIGEPITSPTFALAQHYDGRLSEGAATRLVHLDLYRLELSAAADELFVQEEEDAAAMARMDGVRVVLAVEWPERLSFLPQEAWRVRLEHRGDGRRVHWLAPASPLEKGKPAEEEAPHPKQQATGPTAG